MDEHEKYIWCPLQTSQNVCNYWGNKMICRSEEFYARIYARKGKS